MTAPLFCKSIANMRSKSLKSDGRMGREIDVISIPLLFDAARIRGSAGLPFRRPNPTRTRNSSRSISAPQAGAIAVMKRSGESEVQYLVVADGAGGVDPETGIQPLPVHQIREHALRRRTPADVP